jgi:hypothetical protein
MNQLLESLEEISNSLPYIPSSQNFWLNRTNDGLYYESFIDNEIIGLDINELKLSELDKIRKIYTLKNGNVRYDGVQLAIKELVHSKNSRKIREAPKGAKRSAEISRLTMVANQIFNFAFKIKKGDFVIVPSHGSKTITIGRITEKYIDNDTTYPLQRKIEWLNSHSKSGLDPNFYRLFFTQQALTNINKYKDVVLRTTYDFYSDEESSHLVLNVSTRNKINAVDEAAFTFKFLDLLDGYMKENSLPYNIADLSMIVNLNSPGKKKFFGPRAIIFSAAVLMLFIVGGGLKSKNGSHSLKTGGIIQSWSDYLTDSKKREIADELIKRSDSLSIEQQKVFLELIKVLGEEK